MNTRDDNFPDELDAAQVEALRTVFRTPSLDPEALSRIRDSAHQAWLESVNRRRRLRRLLLAVAASAAAIAITVTIFNVIDAQSRPSPLAAHVIRVEGSSLLSNGSRTASLPLEAGAALRVGDSVTTGTPAGLALELAGGISLRVHADSVLRFASISVVELERGAVYVDVPAHTNASLSVRVQGVRVDHLGTQFGVALSTGEISVTVREGLVRVRGPAATEQLAAGERLAISATGTVRRQRITLSGPEWDWAESLAPDFDVENKSLATFVEWFARETGRHLVYRTADAQMQAQRARLHGSIARLTPDAALVAVFTTTSLHYELTDGQIEVASNSRH